MLQSLRIRLSVHMQASFTAPGRTSKLANKLHSSSITLSETSISCKLRKTRAAAATPSTSSRTWRVPPPETARPTTTSTSRPTANPLNQPALSPETPRSSTPILHRCSSLPTSSRMHKDNNLRIVSNPHHHGRQANNQLDASTQTTTPSPATQASQASTSAPAASCASISALSTLKAYP